jgi:hypothetical protein
MHSVCAPIAVPFAINRTDDEMPMSVSRLLIFAASLVLLGAYTTPSTEDRTMPEQ